MKRTIEKTWGCKLLLGKLCSCQQQINLGKKQAENEHKRTITPKQMHRALILYEGSKMNQSSNNGY
jgi:hypothetical protein